LSVDNRIHLLPDAIINQIAAGEVVERPSSVVKELLENAIDAGANSITVEVEDGGKRMIRVHDNGFGIRSEDLLLALTRHATCKLDSNSPFKIMNLGFRGEALASIASVSRLSLQARHHHSDTGWFVEASYNTVSVPIPVSSDIGTTVTVKDLFFSIPPRLKFLRSNKIEMQHTIKIIKNIAMAYPGISFLLTEQGRNILHYPQVDNPNQLTAMKLRCAQVLGEQFVEDCIPFEKISTPIRSSEVLFKGLLGIPTFNRKTQETQYLFVNDRYVRVPMVSHAVRHAYGDLLPASRHPAFILSIRLHYSAIDANVHPTKTEVRFRHQDEIRNIIYSTIRELLDSQDLRTSLVLSEKLSENFQDNCSRPKDSTDDTNKQNIHTTEYHSPIISNAKLDNTTFTKQPYARTLQSQHQSSPTKLQYSITSKTQANHLNDNDSAMHTQIKHADTIPSSANTAVSYTTDDSGYFCSYTKDTLPMDIANLRALPLGEPVAHIHGNYIISQTTNSLIIIDQHAAHERIVFEELKKKITSPVSKQALLIPKIITLTIDEIDTLMHNQQDIDNIGISFEKFGSTEICVRAIAIFLQDVELSKLMGDIAHDLMSFGTTTSVQIIQEKLLSTIACHNSVRAGDCLSYEKMNSLLRTMEESPLSSQCNHGRPSFIKLDIKDIEKLFERK